MKFNWKSRKFIGGLLSILLFGFGVTSAPVVAPVATDIICNVVACDA